MTRYIADVPTEHASRYLQQLCKHWSHKFQVEFDATHGTVRLSQADCVFVAEPARLLLTLQGDPAQGEAATDFARLCDVVTDHLKRFAFREELDVRWSEAA